MYKIVRKIAFATISLILAIVTFTGVTFAWLSINSDAWIEGMQIEATSGKGFLVSVDGYNYSSSLIEDQIVKAILIKYRKGYTINQNGELLDENNENVIGFASFTIYNEKSFERRACFSIDDNEINDIGDEVKIFRVDNNIPKEKFTSLICSYFYCFTQITSFISVFIGYGSIIAGFSIFCFF